MTADIPDALIEKAAQAVADAHNRYVQRSPAPAYMQFDAEVARAVLTAVADEIRADAWDKGRNARGIYNGPDNGHQYDCAGWEDCYCAVYPNPYRKEDQ